MYLQKNYAQAIVDIRSVKTMNIEQSQRIASCVEVAERLSVHLQILQSLESRTQSALSVFHTNTTLQ